MKLRRRRPDRPDRACSPDSWARRDSRAPRVLDGRAGDYIADRFTPDLVQDFQWPAIAAYTNYFATVPHDESDAVLQWTGRELERGFRAGRFDGVRTAQCAAVRRGAVAAGREAWTPTEAIERLLGEQQPRWRLAALRRSHRASVADRTHARRAHGAGAASVELRACARALSRASLGLPPGLPQAVRRVADG